MRQRNEYEFSVKKKLELFCSYEAVACKQLHNEYIWLTFYFFPFISILFNVCDYHQSKKRTKKSIAKYKFLSEAQ